MSNTRIEVSRVETTTPKKFIRVNAHYLKGGTENMSGRTNRRGYYLSVWPIEDKGEGVDSFMLMSGVKSFMEPAKRFSRKTLEAIVERLTDDRKSEDGKSWKSADHGAMLLLIDTVCEKEGLKLREPSPQWKNPYLQIAAQDIVKLSAEAFFLESDPDPCELLREVTEKKSSPDAEKLIWLLCSHAARVMIAGISSERMIRAYRAAIAVCCGVSDDLDLTEGLVGNPNVNFKYLSPALGKLAHKIHERNLIPTRPKDQEQILTILRKDLV